MLLSPYTGKSAKQYLNCEYNSVTVLLQLSVTSEHELQPTGIS